MTDQENATVREWLDLLARIRFGTVKIAGKTVAGSRIKAVGGRLANYADSDGTRVRPGLARLAVDLEIDHGSAKRCVQHLHQLRLLRLVRAGAKPGHADEYRLTIPADLLDRVEVWSPARVELELKRIREGTRGKYRTPARVETEDADLRVPEGPAADPVAGDLRVCQGPAETGPLVPDAPADSATTPGPAGPSGTSEPGPAGPSGTDLLVPQAPATDHGPRHNPDLPPERNLRSKAAGPRAREAANKPDSDGVDEKPAAVTVSPPERCPHGLTTGRRPDGRLVCVACRVAEDRATGRRIAPVIPIRSTG